MTKTHEPDVENPAGLRALRLVLLSALGASLVWIIVTRSLAASLAEVSPETALFLQPQEPRALLTLAKSEFTALLKASEGGPVTTNARVEPTPDEVPIDRLATLSRLAESALLNAAYEADQTPRNPQPNSQQK